MLSQEKYSAKAKAVSFLPDPGGPTKKILLAIRRCWKVKLTLWPREFVHKEVERLLRPVNYEVLQQVLEEFVHLVVLKVRLN